MRGGGVKIPIFHNLTSFMDDPQYGQDSKSNVNKTHIFYKIYCVVSMRATFNHT